MHSMLLRLEWSPAGMVKSARKSDIVKLYVWRMEKMMRMCREQSVKVQYRIELNNERSADESITLLNVLILSRPSTFDSFPI